MSMVLVAGPPCGGKTTYLRSHAAPSDITIEFDALVEEGGWHRHDRSPAALSHARRRFSEGLDALQPGQSAWVEWTAPRRADRGRFRSTHGAEIVVVMASFEVCIERAKAERPPIWQLYIREWFAEWEPSSSGREQVVRTDSSAVSEI